ncbi:RagB/SusD family nutrient uptake outer membrane protein [Spirosoma sp. KNUC1025]|uniref:RagB/SusD family nutrient uptake outer membrane protein n=1 Tax=Spirosoma sp. KNUC1025 TaxID=2894082 RepID=UPI00386D13C0|nr:RagB/SusD family nutrient uptake outer membrane protein [Spirosoma sp. KNUC1025]
MNTKTLALTAMMTGGILLSCSESKLLDQVNPNQASTATFWKTSDDAIKGVNAAYSAMQDRRFSLWIRFLTDLSSDEGYSQSPWTDLGNISKFIVTDYNIPMNIEPFQAAYQGIYRTNQVLENVPNIKMDATLQKRILAEAKVIRAYFYYNMANIWGNVPLVLKSQTLSERPAQNTQQQVFEQVIKDCQEAAVDLPDGYTGLDVGRLHKYSAIALIGKTYMQQRKWAEAATALKQIIDQTPTRFDLVPDYKDNFTTLLENNKESLFEIQYYDENESKVGGAVNYDVAGGSESSEHAQFFGLRNTTGFDKGGWCDGQPTKWLLNEFLKEKDKNGNKDYRLDYTMFYSGSTLKPHGYTYADLTRLAAGSDYLPERDRFWIKYTNYYQSTDSYFSGINDRVIRLADIYLLYAEALNEQGQTAAGIPFANRVRARVNMNALPLTMTQNDFRVQLRHDRVVELAGETQRFWDMKRYGILGPELAGPDAGKKPANESDFDTDFTTYQKGKSELYPIPLYETDANPNIKQNPGW